MITVAVTDGGTVMFLTPFRLYLVYHPPFPPSRSLALVFIISLLFVCGTRGYQHQQNINFRQVAKWKKTE